MPIDSGSAKMSDASLKGLVGISSIPCTFLEFRDFRMVLIYSGMILELQQEEDIKMELGCKFMFLWSFTTLG